MSTVAVFVPWFIAVASLLWSVYLAGHSDRLRSAEAQAKKIDEQNEKIRQLELEMARQQSPLMKQVQDLLTAGLHHPDPSHRHMDQLLEKLDKTILAPHELPELVAMLENQIADPRTPTKEIEAAKALVAIMPLVVTEAALVTRVEQANVKTVEANQMKE
jgi:malonyl CoA-acyl carrier protein transacylase